MRNVGNTFFILDCFGKEIANDNNIEDAYHSTLYHHACIDNHRCQPITPYNSRLIILYKSLISTVYFILYRKAVLFKKGYDSIQTFPISAYEFRTLCFRLLISSSYKQSTSILPV